MYYIIPFKNFGLFLREAEWRIKNKNINEKISELFEEWYLSYDMAEKKIFLFRKFLLVYIFPLILIIIFKLFIFIC